MEVNYTLIKRIYTRKNIFSHKGDYGRLLVVGGSSMYSGSPMLNALAAYRAGCDVVVIAAPESAANAIKAYSPNLIAVSLKGNKLCKAHVKQILELQKKADAMVIGGGLGRSEDVFEAVREILKATRIPTVVDADALRAIDFRLNDRFVLTPHSHEFGVLNKGFPTEEIRRRIDQVKHLALKLNCTILLKGNTDVISDPVNTTINRTGNVYMTKGGMGDTLAGIAGALLARGVSKFGAASAAAYINGRAGDLAAKKLHEGLMATDLLNYIPDAIRY